LPDRFPLPFLDDGGFDPTSGAITTGGAGNRRIDDNEFAFGLGLNPFVRAGWDGDGVAIGAEGGYQRNFFEFDDDLGGDVENWYVGLFIGIELGN
ncbi:MAG: hypothetical protein AAGK78_15670, partial [Planctomycetota bacterium]